MRLSTDALRLAVPVMALAALLAGVFWLRPNAASYGGLNLLLNYAVPIALATLAQMIIMSVNDLDLSMGAFVSFVACVTATYLNDTPLIGVLILMASIAAYAVIGVVIHLQNLPAPGGAAPEWVRAVMTVKPPLVPMAIAASILIAVVAHLVVMRSSFGVLIRGVGGNERSVARAGWSIVAARAGAYGLAACFAVAAGVALVGLATSADANIALRYTLLSIAGVIIGGGEFIGGRVSAIGALSLTLAESFLSFLRISPDWQIGAQGAILIAVLALRLALNRIEARR